MCGGRGGRQLLESSTCWRIDNTLTGNRLSHGHRKGAQPVVSHGGLQGIQYAMLATVDDLIFQWDHLASMYVLKCLIDVKFRNKMVHGHCLNSGLGYLIFHLCFWEILDDEDSV